MYREQQLAPSFGLFSSGNDPLLCRVDPTAGLNIFATKTLALTGKRTAVARSLGFPLCQYVTPDLNTDTSHCISNSNRYCTVNLLTCTATENEAHLQQRG